MKKIGILYHPLKEDAYSLAKKLDAFLNSNGFSPWLCSAWEAANAKPQLSDTDTILSIGGDGTILRAAQAVVPKPTPIIGINLGKLGFMTELSVNETMEKLPALLSGDGWIDERSMLEAEYYPSGELDRLAEKFYALNDVVLARGAISRVIYVEASIDDELLTTYKVDGVILSTATGSTGYSLAAGGPILHPQSKESLLMPIMSHLSSSYPLVLPATATIKLCLRSHNPATLSIDAHTNLPLSDGATVIIRHSTNTIRFLRARPETSFYGSLEQRLKGKQ
jgi:NAD+ kinase